MVLYSLLERFKVAYKVRACHRTDNKVIKKISYRKQSGNILLIRLDAIGDYLLFRNFIKLLRESFPGKKITLCGNELWKGLAESIDGKYLDDFIWINRKRFYENQTYREKQMTLIRQSGFELVIEPTYSRMMLFGDAIAKVSGAEQRIGNVGNTDNQIPAEKKVSDAYYTELLPASQKILFEFDRNKEFFEQLLKQEISLERNFIDTEEVLQLIPEEVPKEDYVVIFPGASEAYKRWPEENFKAAVKFFSKRQILVLIAGGPNETDLGEYLALGFSDTEVLNFCGRTSVSELVGLIANSCFLLTNETVAAHIGAGLSVSGLCMANGRHFGRFSPYPVHFRNSMQYIFPPSIQKNIANYDNLAQQYCNSEGLNITNISTASVLSILAENFS